MGAAIQLVKDPGRFEQEAREREGATERRQREETTARETALDGEEARRVDEDVPGRGVRGEDKEERWSLGVTYSNGRPTKCPCTIYIKSSREGLVGEGKKRNV